MECPWDRKNNLKRKRRKEDSRLNYGDLEGSLLGVDSCSKQLNGEYGSQIHLDHTVTANL